MEDFTLTLYTVLLFMLMIPLAYMAYRRERERKTKLDDIQRQIDYLKRELEELKKC